MPLDVNGPVSIDHDDFTCALLASKALGPMLRGPLLCSRTYVYVRVCVCACVCVCVCVCERERQCMHI